MDTLEYTMRYLYFPYTHEPSGFDPDIGTNFVEIGLCKGDDGEWRLRPRPLNDQIGLELFQTWI